LTRPVAGHDQSAQAAAVRAIPGGAHDGDNLFDLRRVGREAETRVSSCVTGVEIRQRCRRSTSTRAVEQQLGHDPSSGSWNEPDDRRQSTLGVGAA
jgi:hypothetical protein